MKHKIYPCLWFDGKAKEAADFYCSAFKNANIAANNPMVTTCEIEGKLMMGLNGGPMFTMNPSISMVVMAETKDDANKIWNSLLEGGKVMIALEKHPWSELYGWLQDKYGFTWQISLATKENPGFKITPCLLFTKEQFGRAEEAMNYYTSAFNNSSVGMKVLYPEQDENAGKLMYAEFNIDNYPLIAMDGPGNHAYTFNEGVSLVVNCDTQQEIDLLWDKLTDGGRESMCGWLVDRFGVSWQIIPSMLGQLMSSPENGGRVAQALMKMKKLDIETLRNA